MRSPPFLAQFVEFDHFTLDDVDATMERAVKLKYSQSVKLGGAGGGITLTPFNAGHT